ncbi:hypothetical protein HC031_21570 [Planosporangium thailandense]|uniref:PRC-barrel domain-containing protein n=1 Tax=Planosporangium thailandense TaxID=765197 RepID=A0ABX0Y1P7_9ACTN|nr:PRC-barrel domain-containing protein [Planosporangium thailandense]NJC72285.1 hypothetical protein [Planosporangium thailandense]
MHLTYHQIVGRRVVDRDNRPVGRVVDLIARSPDDRTIRVTGLLVGRRALIQRIGRDRWNLHPVVVGWSEVADLDDEHIRLRTRRDDLRRG